MNQLELNQINLWFIPELLMLWSLRYFVNAAPVLTSLLSWLGCLSISGEDVVCLVVAVHRHCSCNCQTGSNYSRDVSDTHRGVEKISPGPPPGPGAVLPLPQHTPPLHSEHRWTCWLACAMFLTVPVLIDWLYPGPLNQNFTEDKQGLAFQSIPKQKSKSVLLVVYQSRPYTFGRAVGWKLSTNSEDKQRFTPRTVVAVRHNRNASDPLFNANKTTYLLTPSWTMVTIRPTAPMAFCATTILPANVSG